MLAISIPVIEDAGERIETERGVAGAGSRSGVTVFMV